MVFFYHLWLNPGFYPAVRMQLTFYAGVTLFFVLSGFLITYRYYDKVQASGAWLRQYFVNRFARIYPVYFLALTVVILLGKNFSLHYLAENYTLTHQLFHPFRSQYIAIMPSWSLTVEECFYISAPVIFLLVRKYNLLAAFLFTLSLLAPLLFLYGDTSFTDTVFPVLFGSFWGCALIFFTGIGLARFVMKKEKSPVPAYRNSRYTYAGIAGIVFCLSVLAFMIDRNPFAIKIVMLLVNNLLLPFPVAVLYFGLIYEDSLLRRILSGKLFTLLGKSSYAFYLIHVPVIHFIGVPFLKDYFGDGYYNLYVLAMFIICLLISILIYLLYESPLNKWIRRKLNTQSTVPPPIKS